MDEGRNRTAEPHMPGHTIDEFLVNTVIFFLFDSLASVAIFLLLYLVLILSFIACKASIQWKISRDFFSIFIFSSKMFKFFKAMIKKPDFVGTLWPA